MAGPGEVSGERGGFRTLVVVSAAHLVSHFHIFVLPPLFPFLRGALNVDFIALALALTIFNVVSAVTQAPMGFVVDRLGPRRMLIVGLCLGGAAFLSLAVFTTYYWLLVAAALAGLANAVYHPADYAILSSEIDATHMGKAFSVHTFAGFLGGAAAPGTLFAIASSLGLKAALIAAGALGFIAALALALSGGPLARARPHRPWRRRARSPLDLLSPAILALTGFFVLISLSTGGIQNFALVALVDGYGVDLAVANLALTAFMLMSAFGVLAGGAVADRTRRHGQVAALGFALAGIFVLILAFVNVGPLLVVIFMAAAGFLSGVIAPSRDMLVRAAAEPGTEGRVFGIVTTGFNIGGMVGPILFGWILDHGEPRWVFGASAVFIALTVVLLLVETGALKRMRPSPAE